MKELIDALREATDNVEQCAHYLANSGFQQFAALMLKENERHRAALRSKQDNEPDMEE